jgi:hypothetical protein
LFQEHNSRCILPRPPVDIEGIPNKVIRLYAKREDLSN